MQCRTGGGRWQEGPWQHGPLLRKLALGALNVTSLGRKELELVQEVELDIVGLTSTYRVGSGTKVLDRGWSLSYSGVAQGERGRAGVGILTSPWLAAVQLEFVPVDERVASIRNKIVGKKTMIAACPYAPNKSLEYLAFLE